MFREPNDSPLKTTGVRHPALFWGTLAGLLVLMALLVPTSWTGTFSTMLGETQGSSMGAFSDEVQRIDSQLRAGEPVELTDDELARMKVDLQVRRLYASNPMSVEDAREAEDIFRDFEQRIAVQELEGSKNALRQERNKQLVEALPRLKRDRVDAALETLREQIRSSRTTVE